MFLLLLLLDSFLIIQKNNRSKMCILKQKFSFLYENKTDIGLQGRDK